MKHCVTRFCSSGKVQQSQRVEVEKTLIDFTKGSVQHSANSATLFAVCSRTVYIKIFQMKRLNSGQQIDTRSCPHTCSRSHLGWFEVSQTGQIDEGDLMLFSCVHVFEANLHV